MKKIISLVLLLAALMLAMSAAAQAPQTDRAGSPIDVPQTVERIVCLAPSTSQILNALGVTDALVAVDTYTAAQIEQTATLPTFDMMTPDCEQIAALAPDVVFISDMSTISGSNPYQVLMDLGICVVNIPSSTSIEAIKEDIVFVGDVVSREEAAQQVNEQFQQTLDSFAQAAQNAESGKKVYFEISPLPYLYSFGAGTFLNELIALTGAQNVFAEENGWLSISEEQVVSANPDIIFTSADYMQDAVGEIMGREGWQEITAIKNGDVYLINANDANQPCQNIVRALAAMAEAVDADAFAGVLAQ